MKKEGVFAHAQETVDAAAVVEQLQEIYNSVLAQS